MFRYRLCFAALTLPFLFSVASTQTFYAGLPYLQAGDSPFVQQGVPDLVIEDCEDGLFNLPGLKGWSNTPGTTLSVGGPDYYTDSVDADDGVIDGYGRDGYSMGARPNVETGKMGYTFAFDPWVLESLPTSAGLVWTDGTPGVEVLADFFDANGTLVGTAGPNQVGDYGYDGLTAEDRFFGAQSAAGIASFTIYAPNSMNNMEVDHLQFAPLRLFRASGHARLEGYTGDTTGEPIDIEVWQFGVLMESRTLFCGPDGAFGFSPTTSGAATLMFQFRTGLRKAVDLNLDATPELSIEVMMANGDVDGDNAVTVFDYTALSDAFDTVSGDTNWNPYADLDGDGAVSVFDYSILSQNFDMVGD